MPVAVDRFHALYRPVALMRHMQKMTLSLLPAAFHLTLLISIWHCHFFVILLQYRQLEISGGQRRGWKGDMRHKIGLLAIAAILLVSVSARATVISYTVVVNNSGANYLPGESGSFGLPKFNPSYGTLQSVSLSVTGNSLGGRNVIDNESTRPNGSATLTIGSQIEVSGPGALVVLVIPQQSDGGAITADNDAAPNFIGTDSRGVIGTASSDTQNSAPTDFSSYIGAGNLTYTFTSADAQDIQLTNLNFGNLAFDSESPLFNFEATVYYTYDGPLPEGWGDSAVPEPGTLGMGLTLGGMAMAFLARRRAGRKQNARPGGSQSSSSEPLP